MKKPIFLLIALFLIVSLHAQVSKTVTISAGGLAPALTADEKSTITNLTVTGTIDSRDFKTMKDSIPNLAVVDLSGTTISAYNTNRANTVPANAFDSKSKLISVDLPESVIKIGDNAFYHCTNLTVADIPSSVVSIGMYALSYCPALTSVIIPESVTTIGNYAFVNSTGLTSIYSYVTVPSILNSYEIFYGVNKTNCTLYVPYGYSLQYSKLNELKNFTHIVEIPGLFRSAINQGFGKSGGSKKIRITSGESWTASSDQSWLNISKSSGIAVNDTLVVSADEYSSSGSRSATITIHTEGQGDKLIKINQYNPVNVSSGGLYNLLGSNLEKINYLTLTGTINSSDFKTMKDNMPLLKDVDLSGVSVTEYNGNMANTLSELAFLDCKRLESIILPQTLKTIDGSSLRGCGSLVSVTIPLSVTKIGVYAFLDCISLKSITIPETVTSLDFGAFFNCTGLTTITSRLNTPIVIEPSVFNGVDKTSCKLYVPWGTSDRYKAVANWKAFTNIIDFSWINISPNLLYFDGTEQTQKVEVTSSANWTASSNQSWLVISPLSGSAGIDTLTVIAAKNNSIHTRSATITFHAVGYADRTVNVDQYSLVEVTAGNLYNLLGSDLATITSLKLSGTIDARDFKTIRDNMPMLTEVDLSRVAIVGYYGSDGPSIGGQMDYPEKEVPAYAFYQRKNLEKVVLPDSVIAIEEGAFMSCESIVTFNLPKRVTAIAANSFYNCELLKEIDLSNQVTSIGENAFNHCMALDTIIFSNHLTSIGVSAFENCGYLRSVDLSKAHLSIGNRAFSNCGGIQILKGSDSISSIGEGAFYSCMSLDTITFTNSLTSIGVNAFGNSMYLRNINIPASVVSIGVSAFTGCRLLVKVNANNPNYSDSDGLLFDKKQSTLFYCPIDKPGIYKVPETVTTIADYAFEGCYSLQRVDLPDNLSNIGYTSFSGCSGFNTITIPSRVKKIGNYAFYACYGTNSVTALPKIPVDLTKSNVAFHGIDKTTSILYVPFGSKSNYQAALYWKDFLNITELPGFIVSDSAFAFRGKESRDTLFILSNTTWKVSSDQSWLTVNHESGSNNDTLFISATPNTSKGNRSAILTISSEGSDTVLVEVTQQPLLPNDLLLAGLNVVTGTVDCFNASDTITVAGSSTVLFKSGSAITLIAGKSILFLPGFTAEEGSFVSASITTTNSFCEGISGSIVDQPESKSITVDNSITPDLGGRKLVKVYPNPNNGRFTLDMINIENGASVGIFTLTGSKVYQSTVSDPARQLVDLSGIEKGIYLVKINDRNEQITKKIIVN